MRKNIVKGVFVAPLASGILQGLLMKNWGALVFALVFAYPLSLAIGLPTLLLLERNKKATLSNLLIAGFLGGAFVGLFFTGSDLQAPTMLLGLLLFAFHGLLVAFAFWFVALRMKEHSRAPV